MKQSILQKISLTTQKFQEVPETDQIQWAPPFQAYRSCKECWDILRPNQLPRGGKSAKLPGRGRDQLHCPKVTEPHSWLEKALTTSAAWHTFQLVSCQKILPWAPSIQLSRARTHIGVGFGDAECYNFLWFLFFKLCHSKGVIYNQTRGLGRVSKLN